MKKIYYVIFVFVITVHTGFLSSETNSNLNFLPLNVGNVWVYNCTAFGMACSCAKRFRLNITSTVFLNGKTYFVFQASIITVNCSLNNCYGPALGGYLRVDSISSNIYAYSFPGCPYSPFEVLIDSMNANLGDTIKVNCSNQQSKYACIDTNSQVVFGSIRRSKNFAEFSFETGYGRRYSEGIGLIGSGYGSLLCNQNSTLIGCVINGTLYGDTNFMTGMNQISSEIPGKFELSQNYPNPFNPSTNIGFRIAEFGLVLITVYDALGKEMQTLVNQELSSGTYEVDFDGSNLPSGVYYYKLASGKFTETKRMVLVK